VYIEMCQVLKNKKNINKKKDMRVIIFMQEL